MAFGKKNTIKVDVLSYNLGLIGESGIGKTTIIKEMCEKLAGEDGYLFLECGKEDGADAIDGINYINCPTWSDDYNEYTNSAGFEDVIDDIVDNKTSEYPSLRTVVIDTYDQLIEISKENVIRMHNAENRDKPPVKSIKACFGGYMAGEDKATEIVLNKLWELKTVGVSFIIIGHTKIREQEDISTGRKYSSLTTNMSMRDFNAIKTKLHFLGVASIDRELVQEKSEKKDNKGKNIMKNVIASESRKITFRDNSYSIDAKSRFSDIIPEINDFSSDALIKALEDAIKAEQAKSGKSYEDTEKEQADAEAKRLKEIEATEKANKEKKELDKVLKKITDYIKANKSNMETIKPLLSLSKELGFNNPTEIDNIKDAEKVAKLIEG